MSEQRKLNPLIMLAAISVTLFSLLGIAALTGVLPTSFSKNAETALEAEAPKAAPEKAKAQSASSTPAKPRSKAEAPARTASAPAPEPSRTAAAVCNNCGVIAEVRAIKQAGEGSGLGAVAGGVVGGLLGNQVGGGSGKKIATVAGAAGGAYAGHQVEKNMKSTTRYDVIVNMNDGSTRTFSYDAPPAYQPGAKVRVVNDTLTAG